MQSAKLPAARTSFALMQLGVKPPATVSSVSSDSAGFGAGAIFPARPTRADSAVAAGRRYQRKRFQRSGCAQCRELSQAGVRL